MNKLFRKSISMAMITTMAIGLFTFSYAAEAKTIEVNGYITEASQLLKGEKAIDRPQFSVSNVIDTLDTNTLTGVFDDWFIEDIDKVFVVNPSSKVVLVDKGGVVFEISKLVKDDDGSYYTMTYDQIDITGPVEILLEDESGAVDENGQAKYTKKIVDFSELGEYGIDFPAYLPGDGAVLTEPGDYVVNFRYDSMSGSSSVFIKVVDSKNTGVSDNTPKVKTIKALPTNSKVMIDGQEKLFEAYNIDGNNYFKLRDLAMVINGSKKQFQVEWNNEKQSINLISNMAYTAVDSEMKIGDGKIKNAVLNTSKVYKDGVVLDLLSYNINGNNFFKLRDVGDSFNIVVNWDESTKTIQVDTSK